MRTPLWILVILVSGWLENCACAGVYNSTIQEILPPARLDKFKPAFSDLRAVPLPLSPGMSPDPGSPRSRYLKLTAELESLDRDGALSNRDRIDLGACYIRLRRFPDAVRVLRGGDQTHFMVLANLATAFYELGELDSAVRYQDQVLANWPAVWADWSLGQWYWYHRCERLFQTLLQRRQEEARTGGGRASSVRSIDPLFPKIRIPDTKHYEAGPLLLLAEDLPQDAPQLVLQLMVWTPYDDRLSWLYAELLNLDGKIELAHFLMDDLVFNRGWSSVEDLKRHRQILKVALDQRKALTPDMRTALLWPFAPRGLVGVPAVGAAAMEAAWPIADLVVRRKEELQGTPFPMTQSEPVLRDPLPKWHELIIGFGSGVLVTLLMVLQGRQWFRRRGQAPARPPATV